MFSDRGATLRALEDRDEAFLHQPPQWTFNGGRIWVSQSGGAADGDAVTGI